MSATAFARPALPSGHIHLPSVHIRNEGRGFDYEEDLYVVGRGRRRVVRRVVRLLVIEHDEVVLARETSDQLCPEDVAAIAEALPDLMEEGNPDVEAEMEERARLELARQLRIAAGKEKACAVCGCSDTRACSGGCIWATRTTCSRCV